MVYDLLRCILLHTYDMGHPSIKDTPRANFLPLPSRNSKRTNVLDHEPFENAYIIDPFTSGFRTLTVKLHDPCSVYFV